MRELYNIDHGATQAAPPVRDFILFHNKRPPKDMGAPEIRAYLSHLAINRNVAAST